MRTLTQLDAELVGVTRAQEDSKAILTLYTDRGYPSFQSVSPTYARALVKVMRPLLPTINALVQDELKTQRALIIAEIKQTADEVVNEA